MLSLPCLPRAAFASAALLFISSAMHAQVSGNIGYEQQGQGAKARAEQVERSERVLSAQDLPPNANSMFEDAHVLMNVKADEYVAVFALGVEDPTVEGANAKMATLVKRFAASLEALHVRAGDLDVDYIAQPKIYSYDVANNTAREHLSGFELKKNVSIHYRDRDLLDALVLAAAPLGIFDLVKVGLHRARHCGGGGEAAGGGGGGGQQKLAADQKLLGIRVRPGGAIYADRSAIHYPAQLYDSYTAAESAAVTRPRGIDNFTVIQARKGRTFFFNGLDGDGFDKVLNPVVIEPVVQFTLYLKVKYEVAR